MKTSVVDLFCGAGGFSAGAAEAHDSDIRIVLAIDDDSDYGRKCLAVHKKNHPECHHVSMRLGPQTENALLELILKHTATADHVHTHASPPCQEFSIAKHKKYKKCGEKKELTAWFVHFLKTKLHPRLKKDIFHTASMENVVQSSTIVGQNEFVCLRASDFGASTIRRRLFLKYGWSEQYLCRTPGPFPGALLKESLADWNVIKSKNTQEWRSPRYFIHEEYLYTLTTRWGGRIVMKVDEKGRTLDKRLPLLSEFAAIQGFPLGYFEEHALASNRGLMEKMIGNSVSPPVAREIVRAARKTIKARNVYFKKFMRSS